MDSRKISAIVLVCFGLLFGVYAMVQILTQGWNALTETFKYIGGALLIAGFVAPRFGFWVLLISMAYLDLGKRLLVVGDFTTYYDIAVILAFSPLLALMVLAGIVARDVRQHRLHGPRLSLFIVTCLGMAFLGGTGYSFVGGGLGAMKQAANYGAFVSLFYIVPALIDSEAQMHKMFRRLIWIFIPVALYALWQAKYGLAWWEIAYLETGLSVEGRILFGQDYRIFSTLNSSQNLSKVMSMIGVLALCLPWVLSRSGTRTKAFGIALFFLFFTAAYLSGSRTGLVMGLVAVGCFVLYRFKSLTLLFYSFVVSAFVFLVIASDWILESKILNQWTGALSEGMQLEANQASRINLSTFSVRLDSFSNMKDADYWTPFGFKLAGRSAFESNFVIHDMFGKMLVTMGYIPMGILSVIFVVVMWHLHSSIWRSRYLANLKLVSVSMVICVIVGGFSATENLGTFPVNAIFYLSAGVIMWAREQTRRAVQEAARQPKPEPAPARPPLGGISPRPSVS